MSVYKTVKYLAQIPYHYYAAGGGIASHDANESELAVDERGNPEISYQIVNKGDLVYTDAADYDSLNEAQQEKAYYCPRENFVKEHERLGTFETVEASSSQKSASDKSSGAKSTAKSSNSKSNDSK